MSKRVLLLNLFTRSRFSLTGFIRLISVLAFCVVPVIQADQLPANHAKTGFSLEESRRLERQLSVASILAGGDGALYWTNRVSQSMATAVIPPGLPVRMLEVAVNDRIGEITAESSLGSLSLDEFLSDSRSYAQGFVVVHRGRIVYEQYPGMRQQDSHLWASNAKPLASLLIDLLIDDGTLDQNQTYGHYMPDFRGTAWENIRLIDILDMTPGLDTAEDDHTRRDPDSIAIRTFLSEFGEPYSKVGKVETIREVLRSARKIGEPGNSFDYGSPVTQALVLLTEEVTQKKWTDLFDERVWSHMSAEGGLQVHLAPDGTAAVHGLVSSRLRDMARFGMLYTPSWNQVAGKRIVNGGIIQRIREGVRDTDFFMKGYDGPVFTKRLNETILGSSRQWDAVFADGDFFKSGLMGQGLYVSPDRDLVVAFFSTSRDPGPIQRYLRPLAKSKIFADRK
jgi:CubicO group peptidase (beta-lactamase class C family)